MEFRNQRFEFNDVTSGARLRNDCPNDSGQVPHVIYVRNANFNADGFGTSFDNRDCLRHGTTIEHNRTRCLVGTAHQSHCFSYGSSFVKQRRVCGGQANQVRNHCLEVDQRFQPTLRNFGLIRRICGVPSGVFQNIAPDNRWGQSWVISQTNHRNTGIIAARVLAQNGERLMFRHGTGKLHRALDVCRHGGTHKFF